MAKRELTKEQKEIRKLRDREYRRKNKDKITARLKEWHKANPNKQAEYAKKARKLRGKEINTRNRKRRKIKGDHIRGVEKNIRERSPKNFISWRWSQTKARRRSKKLEKTINKEYLINLWEEQNGMCAITGKKMLYESGHLHTVSIDRIDSNLGYIEGNVQLVCQAINLGKGVHSNEEMRSFWDNRD